MPWYSYVGVIVESELLRLLMLVLGSEEMLEIVSNSGRYNPERLNI